MPYDPNDPNQGSQAPPEDQSTAEWQAKNAMTSGTINDLIRSRPAIASWLKSHNDGRNLSDSDKSQLVSLMRQQGIDPTNLEVDDDTGVISWPKHVARDIALGSAMAFGPVVAAWALPYLGIGAGAGESWDAAGNFIGPSTFTGGEAATTAATTAAGASPYATGSMYDIPASAAGTGTTAAGGGAWDAAGNFIGDSTVSSVTNKSLGGKALDVLTSDKFLRYGLPIAGNVATSLIQAKAAGDASEAEQKYLEEALAYAKQKDAGNISREAGRYGDYKGNISGYLANADASGSRMAQLLGLNVPPRTLTTQGAPAPLVNSNPLFAPTTNIAPGADIPLAPAVTSRYAQPQAPPAQQPMITVQAPDGRTQQYPASTLAHWQSVPDAKILQGAA